MVIECQLAWKRVVVKMERGEIYDALDAARRSIAERVRKAAAQWRAEIAGSVSGSGDDSRF
jgi:hypothetical protein